MQRKLAGCISGFTGGLARGPSASLASLACAALLAAAGCSGREDDSGSTGALPRLPTSARSPRPGDAQPEEDSPVEAAPDAGTPEPPAGPPAEPPRPKYAHEWVVSPSGSDSAAGTGAAPFRTIRRAVAAAGPGDRVTVRAGTYAERVVIGAGARAGTADQPVLLQGEGRPRIVPAEPMMVMVEISRPHWILDGFEVDALDQARIAVGFHGSTQGSALKGSLVHSGRGPSAVTVFNGAAGVLIEGNEIRDFWRDGDDSHGVLVQPGTTDTTVRDNRIHGVSGDSVQCIGPEGVSSLPPASGLLVEGNDFHSNRENAVDIKTCRRVVARRNSMHDFLDPQSPGGCAVVVHMSADDVLIEDNDIFRVGKAIALGGNHSGPVPTRVRIQRNRIRDVRVGGRMDGVGIRVENSSGARVISNTFTRVSWAAMAVGGGEGGPTESLRIADNLFDAELPLVVGAQAPGLSVGPNGFLENASFRVEGVVHDYAGWKALGFGARSWLSGALFASQEELTPAPGAVDQGSDEGLPFCGAAPDLGAVETGC